MTTKRAIIMAVALGRLGSYDLYQIGYRCDSLDKKNFGIIYPLTVCVNPSLCVVSNSPNECNGKHVKRIMALS